jgi:hypothetical protein
LFQLLEDVISLLHIYGRFEEPANNPPLFVGGSKYYWADQEFYGQMEYPSDTSLLVIINGCVPSRFRGGAQTLQER